MKVCKNKIKIFLKLLVHKPLDEIISIECLELFMENLYLLGKKKYNMMYKTIKFMVWFIT